MPRRWRDPSAFRADPDAAPAARPSRRQATALIAVLALVAGAVVVASYVIRPQKARAFDLFHGSVFLSDVSSPVGVDLATGKPTLRLSGAAEQVGITSRHQTLGVVPLTDHTLLLNQATGEFNMVDNSGFVVKRTGGGVPLVKRPGASTSMGVAARNGEAYIVRTGATGGTDVYLVNQPTVESAINASGSVRPRASGSMTEAVDTAAGGTASANGNLWLLAGPPDGRRTIRELSVPAGSSAGATLVRSDHRRLSGAAAIGTATARTDGTGTDSVGVASPSRIDLFAPGAGAQHVSYRAPAGIESILPTSNGQGRLAFFMQGTAGWYLVSINADGTGLRPPVLVKGLPPTALLAEPAASNGRLYTLDKSDGRLYQIGYDGVAHSIPGRSTYPVVPKVEANNYGDAYLIARGPRVIFDSPSHANALMVFTDGSHAPRTIVKSAAVTVNASGGADALTRSTAPPAKRVGKPSGAKPAQVAQPVNTKINCKIAKQKPHIPLITSAATGSRSVTLAWSYPILDVQDCYPSTYTVSFQTLSGNAPQPPSSVRVQSQTGATISGLFPSTRYAVTVRAYINGQSTASAPQDILTGPEGPAAPTALAASADSAGDWRLSWDSCGTITQGCVTAQTWTITPNFCDGRGVSSPPPAMTVTADPTSKHQPPAIYKGGDALLGRGLQFVVQGTGDQGQAGAPSAKTACIYSWSPPVASALSLSASHPADTSLGGSSTTNVTLDLGPNPIRDVGGVGAVVTFRLTGPDGTRTTRAVTYNGNGDTLATKFTGITAGATYTAGATVRTAHGGGSATLAPVPVVARANWPSMSLTASCPPNGTLHLGCNLTVNIHGLASSQANGELFDTVDTDQAQTQIRCGNQAQPLSRSGFDPATGSLTLDNLSQVFNRGFCIVTVLLKESASDRQPLVFGGSVSPELSVGLTLGSPQTLSAGDGDFGAAWEKHAAAVSVSYNGQYRDDEVGQITTGWVDRVFAPNGDACGSSNQQPTHGGIDVQVDPECVNRFGDQTSGWTVSVTYTDTGTNNDHTLHPSDPALSGGPPTYQFCTPGTFSATWDGTSDSPQVDVAQSGGDLSGCGNWSYTLTDPNGHTCPTGGNDSGPPPAQLNVRCGLVAGVWTVTVGWTDPAGRNRSSGPIPVGGTMPTPTPTPTPTPSPSSS